MFWFRHSRIRSSLLVSKVQSKDKRTARSHKLLKQSKRFIECLKDKLSDEEITEAEAEFDRLEREASQVTADLEDESGGNS